MKSAFFAGGCFWCITPVFAEYNGVVKVTAGYSGGKEKSPTYEAVKSQSTLHRETIRIEYDEAQVSFEDLGCVFLRNVDAFDGGGQFIDRGRSYTLAVYYQEKEELLVMEKLISELEAAAGKTVYVALEKFDGFYDAEEYHQNYYLKNPEAFAEEMRSSGRPVLEKQRKEKKG